MLVLASLAATSLILALPQGGSSGDSPTPVPASAAPSTSVAPQEPLLNAAAHEAMRKKLQRYLEAEVEYEFADGSKEREKTGKAREKAKEDFRDEWEKGSKKGDLLASMPDLRAIYTNCFLVKPLKGSTGTLRKESLKLDETMVFDYSTYVAKNYKPAVPIRTVIVLPGTVKAEEKSTWVEGRDYFNSVWDKTDALNNTAFHIPHLPDRVEMDPAPDFSREGQEAQEQRRIACVFATYGQTMNAINVDRPRVFLDCSRGNCAFGLRFVSLFPDRFAGVILRSPTAVEDIRLGSLLGTAVLLLQTPESAGVCETLKKKLEAVSPNSVTILDATDEYPHKGSAAAITVWMDKQERNMTPARVVIEPNHDQFNRAYWVRIETMNPVHTSSVDQKPRIEVTADRATNRIVVKAQGVETFSLLLNDALVDLDKEFTVVVNDKAVTEKRTRDQQSMQKLMIQRRDWDVLFPVVYSSSVPK